MTQNRSSAVMQQRRDKAKASLDDFPTPPWATRAVIRHAIVPRVRAAGGCSLGFGGQTAADPCCNRGHMVRPLLDAFPRVLATDIADYSGDPRRAVLGDSPLVHRFEPDGVADFLLPSYEATFPRAGDVDWFFFNPPYKLALPFVLKARELARVGVAAFVRVAFVEGQERFQQLFEFHPPSFIAWFAERVTLLEGVLRDPDVEFWNLKANDGKGGWQKPASATAYCWMIWLRDGQRLPDVWIPPCRLQLTRPGDYPVNPDERGVFTPPAAAGQEALL